MSVYNSVIPIKGYNVNTSGTNIKKKLSVITWRMNWLIEQEFINAFFDN